MSLVDTDAIVRRLVEFTAAAVPEGVQVLDGRDYSQDLEPRLVVVGYSGSPQAPVVEVTRALDEGSLDDTRFDVAIRGTVVEWDGVQEFPAKRQRAQATLVALNAALEADRSMGGLAYDAWLAPTMQWHQIADSEGNAVEVDITVTVQVYA